jgi:type VI secretion system VasD/TssJ family lipoprotein
MRKHYHLFILLFIFFLSGCGGSNSLQLDLQCSEDCNNSNVIVVRVYQLKNAERFKFASLESLIRKPEETLGEDLIPNSKFEKIIGPNETFTVEDLELLGGAAYLGIIGDFHSPAKDGWQQVVSLSSGVDKVKISIKENSLSVETD